MVFSRRPGRPLVFGPDIPSHALVGLRSGLKQSCLSRRERALSVRSTPAATAEPTQRLVANRLLLVCRPCLFGLSMRG